MSACTCGHRPDHHIDSGCTGHITPGGRCPCRHSEESAAQAAHPDQLALTDLLEGVPS